MYKPIGSKSECMHMNIDLLLNMDCVDTANYNKIHNKSDITQHPDVHSHNLSAIWETMFSRKEEAAMWVVQMEGDYLDRYNR